jgi:hypothetical protein
LIAADGGQRPISLKSIRWNRVGHAPGFDLSREAVVKGFGPVKQQGGNSATATATLSHGVSELSQLALWMAATLAGMVTAALTARTPFFRGVMRRLGIAPDATESRNGSARRAPARPAREHSLPMLAEAIVGSSKSAIVSVFGPPRSAVVMHAAAAAAAVAGAGTSGATYWHADTWYYPLPKNGPLAMAIEFQGDDARRVEFLRAPEV